MSDRSARRRFAAAAVIEKQAAGYNVLGDPRPAVTAFVSQRKINEGTFVMSLAALVKEIANQVDQYGSIAKIPATSVGNIRNDMYLASEALRFLMKDRRTRSASRRSPSSTPTRPNSTTRPASSRSGSRSRSRSLGLGTMIGWKRIVVTVGEKIGKSHLTYAQGASAELVAAATIAAADVYGLPVSTTHVLSSGVAGTMAANGSGLQMATVRNLLMAWVLTLPAAITLSATLYIVFLNIF